MTSANTLQAIIRAARPKFKNKHDRVAYAVHAYMLGEGYKPVAVGKDADTNKDVKENASEVALDGWNETKGVYAFNYVDTKGKRPPLMVKAVPMDNKLLVNFLEPSTDKPPSFVELDVDTYTTDSDDTVDGYRDLDELAARVHKALAELRDPRAKESAPGFNLAAGPTGTSDSGATPGKAAPSRSGAAQEGRSRSSFDPLREEPRRSSNYDPRAVVDDPQNYYGDPDLLPPGIPRDVSGVPGLMRGGPEIPPPGGRPAFPGGMHVGPDDPMFAPHRARPGMGLPGGPGPGIRWDPVAPEGLPGFNAEDFQRPGGRSGRGGPGIHPDLMQPGPGRGTDFDSMFG